MQSASVIRPSHLFCLSYSVYKLSCQRNYKMSVLLPVYYRDSNKNKSISESISV